VCGFGLTTHISALQRDTLRLFIFGLNGGLLMVEQRDLWGELALVNFRLANSRNYLYLSIDTLGW
jgi:hypothetical protein